jgi:NAD(P)-dependent dehydrogenase (short-subunit alcohol dehydrogenase family)
VSGHPLAGRTVLVTGASRGIGRAIASACAAGGASVALHGRSARALADVAASIRAAGGDVVTTLAHDLASRDGVEALIDALAGTVERVDVLVNNAGVGSRESLRPVVDFDPAFWDTTLALNLTAPFLLARAIVPGMVAAGFGRVINVASINGRVPSVHSGAYVASKHGLIGLTRVLALEVAGSGVTVNAVCPGVVDVGDDRRLRFDAERAGVPIDDFERRLTPMGGRLLPDDIAPLVVFLASAGAATITGQSINVDKGAVMS